MPKAIKLSDELINNAVMNGKAQHRSPSKKIEYWARIGKIVDENPDQPLSFIKGILVGIQERKADDVSEYEFGYFSADQDFKRRVKKMHKAEA